MRAAEDYSNKKRKKQTMTARKPTEDVGGEQEKHRKGKGKRREENSKDFGEY